MTRIVVGYNGTDDAKLALRWASTAAVAGGQQLVVASTLGTPSAFGDPTGLSVLMTPDLMQAVTDVAEEGAGLAREAGVADVVTAVDQRPIDRQLVELSDGAELVVMGTRGRGEIRSAIGGSNSFSVCAHAHCPVVVVKGDGQDRLGPEHPAVVGVDGSPVSLRAVELAADAAAARGAELIVAVAWSLPVADPSIMAAVGPLAVDTARSGQRARAEEVAQLAQAHATARQPDIRVSTHVAEGLPAEVVLGAHPQPALLVTGSRGHGGFTGLLLGSVSHQILHEANCPVAVIR